MSLDHRTVDEPLGAVRAPALAVAPVLMSRPVQRDTGFSHAVREHEPISLCGAGAAAGYTDWPELGQPWPAGPSRCSACAQVMSTSRRA